MLSQKDKSQIVVTTVVIIAIASILLIQSGIFS